MKQQLEPLIIPRDQHNVSRKDISPNVLKILQHLNRHGFIAYIVGGGIRDLLLGHKPKDLDVVTSATPNQVKKLFRNCRLIGRRFRLAHLHFRDEIIEVATFRSAPEDMETAAAQPEEAAPRGEMAFGPVTPVVPETPGRTAADASPPGGGRRFDSARHMGLVRSDEGMILRDNLWGTPAQDAWRRDFTLNALFYNLQDFSLIDYVGGLADIRAGVVRSIGDPSQRFVEDPVRMVRAVRFAAKLDFAIAPETWDALLARRNDILKASSDRMYEEILKLFLLGSARPTYLLLRETGLFERIFPVAAGHLQSEGAESLHRRWLAVCDWIDARIKAGRPVAPAMMYALLFGPLIGPAEGEVAPGATSKEHLLDFVTTLAPSVKIPRVVAMDIRHALDNQWRFKKTRPAAARRFLRMPAFPLAWEYWQFQLSLEGGDPELTAWWEKLRQGEPVEAVVSGKGKAGVEVREGSRRRRRRGGRRRRRPGGTNGAPDAPREPASAGTAPFTGDEDDAFAPPESTYPYEI
jgi:poly(A) polymerase